ncbi:Manganese-transporting ATPase 13A1 [Oopsacas minuta]|uniref:Manganese-transporting ATPase 13A1 n=1 Tax=Oopsacas minuta TaxID=111878 RepID=A0AAV7J837_9METZ|nr:Manganese-transporting ATPase 13A1 [Oopsacas minuta]
MPSIVHCDEIESYKLYKHRSFLLRGYAIPFMPIYGIILYQLSGIYNPPPGLEEEDQSLISLIFKSGLELPLALLIITLLAHTFMCLCCIWSVHIYCMITCSNVVSVHDATLVKVIPTPNNGSTELNQLIRRDGQIWFEFQKLRYIYDKSSQSFSPPSLEEGDCFNTYLTSQGLSSKEAFRREKLYGNCILTIDLPLFSELFLERATAPFFIFQLFCVLLWCLDEFWLYALFTLFMLVSLECMVVFQQKRNLSSIREMIREPETIQVYRDMKWEQLPSNLLVPGDIISIHVSRHELTSPCDALLLYGTLIVDEAMLTGESIPQHKESLGNRSGEEEFSFERDSKLNVVFSGTKVLQSEPAPRGATPLKPPNGGVIACVLRTGFNTSQGRLVRTILYGVKRVTANNIEALLFLVFLMQFAVLAAGYVWIHGTMDPTRSRYKLFLQCTFILTSVVPPELPIILSLAVNNSLISLLRSRIFCTEPFRLPNAGKLNFCCFDKTGTLTSSDITFMGVTNMSADNLTSELDHPKSRSIETQLVIGLCHSLASIRGGDMIGDPLEIAAFTASDWKLGKENKPQMPKSLKMAGSYHTARKFHFNSTVKRMSVICVNNNNHKTLVFTKGAPEAVLDLLLNVPHGYDRVHQELVCLGARVLVLAYKELSSNIKIFSSLSREEAETGLIFCGFICFSSAIKSDSKSSIRQLRRSSHRLMMITGDNPYTACYIAHELAMSNINKTLILTQRQEGWEWISPDRNINIPVNGLQHMKDLRSSYDLCVTGDGMLYVSNQFASEEWVQLVRIFARMSPKQKEQVVTSLNKHYYTLMCGDGTNDVGALKHAHIGVSLLSRPLTGEQADLPRPSLFDIAKMGRARRREELMKQTDLSDAPPPVRLGDASIASPFTSRSDSIAAVCNIVRHGRCTLVTILQMYKIIAISALISAYSQSALYLDGIKFSDLQAMLQGMFIAFSFMIFSRIKPLSDLSKHKPIPNVFNLYTLSTVSLQSTIHLCCIIVLVTEAKLLMTDKALDLEAEFEANILNTAVFIISLCMQLNTCTINYRGRPFIPSLYENKPMIILLALGYISLFSLSLGIPEEFCEMMDIIILPETFRLYLLMILVVDIVASFAVDFVLLLLYRKLWMR